MSRHSFSLTAIATSLLLAGAAHAATPASLDATEVLTQFNAVILGDAKSTSHVDGRVYVGGTLTGGDMVQNAGKTAASNYAGVTVGGDMKDVNVNGLGVVVGGDISGRTVNSGASYVGGKATNVNFNGDAWINGNASSVNFNGKGHAGSLTNTNNNNKLAAPTAIMNSTRDAATSTDFGAVLSGLSSSLKTLATTSNGSASSSISYAKSGAEATFNAVNVGGVAVFNLSAADAQVFMAGDYTFNLNGASTVIFNSDASSVNISANFNQAQALGSSMIWNFYNATDVTINRTFGGQILATSALFSNLGGANVEGGVYAKGLNQQGEIHLQAYTGTIPMTAVPEPETYAMLLAGLALLGFTVRRRQGKRAV